MQGQKSPKRSAQPEVYVGVDVVKIGSTSISTPLAKNSASNAPEGLRALKRRLADLPVELIVMEATGRSTARRTAPCTPQAWRSPSSIRCGRVCSPRRSSARQDRSARRAYAGADGRTLEPSALAPAPEALEALQELARAGGGQSRGTALSNRRGASQTASQGRTRPAAQAGPARRAPGRRDRTPHRRRSRGQAPLRHPHHHPRRRSRGGHRPRHRPARTRRLLGQGRLSPRRPCAAGARQRRKAGERHIWGGRAFVRSGLVSLPSPPPHATETARRLQSVPQRRRKPSRHHRHHAKLVVLANVLIKEDRP